MYFNRSWMVGVIAVTVALAGCNSNSLENIEIPIPDAPASIESPGLKTIPVTETTNVESPAEKAFSMPSVDASADEVCQKFLSALNAEEPDHFELLLTPAAINISNRLKFQLPPIAEHGTKLTIGEPKYNTIREKICFIDCSFAATNDSEATDVTMMLRKFKSGWRVAGMMIDADDSELKNLISFENSVDVAQIKSSIEEPISTSAETAADQ